MTHTIHKLAALSGISTRTLRYYDNIGLLRAEREENGYRVYGSDQIDRLQQILFYREMGISLREISRLLTDDPAARTATLEEHRAVLQAEQTRLAELIGTVDKTILALKGEITMSNEEKFAGLRRAAIDENETQYGREARTAYGNEAIDAANRKAANMSQAAWEAQEARAAQISELLRQAVATGDPGNALAQQACALHRDWLCGFWKDGTYSPAAHRVLAESYVADERFRSYYDAIAPGCAVFFRDALIRFCEETTK